MKNAWLLWYTKSDCMSPNSIIFAVYQILNYILFEMSWINTFRVRVWLSLQSS